MAPLPSPSPAGQTAATLPFNQAGGGQGYSITGTCSGTAFTHTQTIQVYYDLSTYSELNGSWPAGCKTISSLVCTVYGTAANSLGQFSTSAHASGCAGAANAVQAHTMSLSSTDAGAAMGTAGTIYTLSAGYHRRFAVGGDVAATDQRLMTKVLFPIAGLPTGWNHNAAMSNAVASQVIAAIIAGGLEYEDHRVSTLPPHKAQAWTLMDWNLIDI